MQDYLLDTCAALWIVNGDSLREPATVELPEALKRNGRLLVSPITAWEIALFVAKKRIFLTLRPEVWFQRLCDLPGVTLAEMPPSVLMASADLPRQNTGRPC